MDTLAFQMGKELNALKKTHASKNTWGVQESVLRLLNLVKEFEDKTGIKHLFDELGFKQEFKPYCTTTFECMQETVNMIKKYAKETTDYAKGFLLSKCKDLHELIYGLYVYITDTEHSREHLKRTI